MTLYINRVGQGQIETVSQCDTRKDALMEVKEYALSDPSAYYYLSSRSCKNWKE